MKAAAFIEELLESVHFAGVETDSIK